MFLRPALLIAGAGLAAAQSLSSQCSSALLSVAASSDAACLDLSLLAPLAVLNTSTTSVIPTVNTWLNGVCGQKPCTNATLQEVVTEVLNGCSSDLASAGLTINDPASIVTVVQAAYPTVREIACLQDTSTNTLCVTEVLTDIQSATTTLSIDNIISMIKQEKSGTQIPIPKNVTCSNCTKAAFTIAKQGYPPLVSGDQADLQSECGASFTDGQMPPNIKETSTNSTASTSGVAPLSVNSFSVGVAMLVVVSSAFTMFA